ncbi:unnamed protein product [Rotaria socialis]|uniref:Uncharacterized protein n=1 Tax=Rotaria socialis TaxID=392032 RepID=A0A821FI20_9BILA|nr:unnamed protein product [Rotaria socialis]
MPVETSDASNSSSRAENIATRRKRLWIISIIIVTIVIIAIIIIPTTIIVTRRTQMTEPTTITIAVNATMKPVSTAPLTTNENLIKSSASTATATTITTRSATTMQMSSESIFTKKEFSSAHEVSDHGNFSDMTTRSTMMQTPELSTMMQTIPDLSSMMMNTQDLSTMNAALSTTEGTLVKL